MSVIDTVQNLRALKAKGPTHFIESLLSFKGQPFKLYGFQREIAETTDFLRDKVAIRKGRQVGGSLLVAALIVYNVATNPFCTVIIISKTKDQASLISTYVRDFFASSVLRDLIDPEKDTVQDLYLLNRSKVITRSAGQSRTGGETLRGHTIGGLGALVFDESAYIPSDAIRNTYFSAAGNCAIVHCSTPGRPVGSFYDACHSARFKHFHIPCSKSPRIPAEDIAFWRSSMSTAKQANEIDAEFAQGEDAVFQIEDIEAAVDDSLPLWSPKPQFKGDKNRNYIYSLDPARIGSDKWALTIGHLDRVALRFVCKHGRVTTPTVSVYALAASGDTAARRAFSFSRSAGSMRMPRQRRATSTSTA